MEEAATVIGSDSALKQDRRVSDRYNNWVCWKAADAPLSERSGCFIQLKTGNYLYWDYPLSPFRAGPLTIGDAINIFGAPTGIQICFLAGNMKDNPEIFATLYFNHSIKIIGNRYDLASVNGPHISLETPVHTVYYNSPTFNAPVRAWQGFRVLSTLDVEFCP